MVILENEFFSKDTLEVAKDLLGKVIFHKYNSIWLSVQIIETEAYLIEEKGSHASLGFTKKRKALFMPPGTIYMYYSRGKDSFNISTGKKGDAVLIKSGIPFLHNSGSEMLEVMKDLNPINGRKRKSERLCSGQTLLCKSLNIKVKEWDQKHFDSSKLFIADVGYTPKKVVEAARLGIPKGRDEHLLYRYIDYDHVKSCTKNPINPINKKLQLAT